MEIIGIGGNHWNKEIMIKNSIFYSNARIPDEEEDSGARTVGTSPRGCPAHA